MKKVLLAVACVVGMSLVGCSDGVCGDIVDEQIECDSTGLLDALRSTAVDACEMSTADDVALQACLDCLEQSADCTAAAGCPCDFGP